MNFKKHLKTTLKNIPNVGESIYRGAESLRDSLKYALVDGGAIFEELGFTNLGPINGNAHYGKACGGTGACSCDDSQRQRI